MLCLKKHHLVLTLSLLALFAVPFLCSSGSVSALSSSISPVIGSVQSIDVSNLGFTPKYLVFDLDYSTANTLQKLNANYRVGSNTTGNPFNTNFSDSFCTYFIRNPIKLTQIVCQFDSTQSPVYKIEPIFSDQFSVGITITLFDVLPGADCPDCPECPPIPETPYGDILNKIYIAILAVSATALCIYFFYAFYNMFFGGIKR